jgi:tetratricopeptide (TPR) repeat protein
MRFLMALLSPGDLIAITVLIIGSGIVALVMSQNGFDLSSLGGDQSHSSTTDGSHPILDAKHPFENHLRQGNLAIKQHRYAQAIAHYEQANALVPDLVALLHKLAKLYLFEQHLDKATALLEQILTLEPHQFEVRQELAHVYARYNQPAKAQAHLLVMLEHSPDNPAVLQQLATVCTAQGHKEAAKGYVNQLISLPYTSKKDRLAYQFEQLQARWEAGEASETLIADLAAAARQDKARQDTYLYEQGAVYLAQGRKQKALDVWQTLYREVSQLLRTSQALQQLMATLKASLVPLLQEMALDALEQQQWEAARQQLMQAIEIAPHQGGLYHTLGQLQEAMGATTKAQIAYQQVLLTDPDNLAACKALARLLEADKQWEQAIAYHRQALTLEPTNAETAYLLGTNLGMMGRLQEAVSYLMQAVQLNPDHQDAWFNLAVALEQADQDSVAQRVYGRLLALNPQHIEAQSNLLRLSHLNQLMVA